MNQSEERKNEHVNSEKRRERCLPLQAWENV